MRQGYQTSLVHSLGARGMDILFVLHTGRRQATALYWMTERADDGSSGMYGLYVQVRLPPYRYGSKFACTHVAHVSHDASPGRKQHPL